MPHSPSPRWIIIPPCLDIEFWHKAVFELAAQNGLSIALSGNQDETTDLILTDKPHEALQSAADVDHLVAILSETGPLPVTLEGVEANPNRHQYTRVVTELTRQAYQDLKGRYVRSGAFAKGPVTLFEDLVLDLPDVDIISGSRRNKAVSQAMDVYVADQATWPTDVLDFYAREIEVGNGFRRFDATGKPRFLAHGPYISMPAGQWEAVFKIEFARALTNKTYRIDWGEISDYQEFVFKPEKPGLYEIRMDWTWKDPSPCEMRLAAMEAIFDGEFVLHDFHVSRLG